MNTTYFLTITNSHKEIVYRDIWVAESETISITILSLIAQAFFHGLNHFEGNGPKCPIWYTISDRFGNEYKTKHMGEKVA
jgi:hypothetical protein